MMTTGLAATKDKLTPWLAAAAAAAAAAISLHRQTDRQCAVMV